jgi:hypothetical protein
MFGVIQMKSSEVRIAGTLIGETKEESLKQWIFIYLSALDSSNPAN